jgi:hypothetical protein
MAVLTKRETWAKSRPQNETRKASDLTPEEQRHARKALHFLRAKLGSWPKLAAAMKVRAPTLCTVSRGRAVTAGLALRAARLAGVPVEDVLSGAWPKAGSCPHCGRLG